MKFLLNEDSLYSWDGGIDVTIRNQQDGIYEECEDVKISGGKLMFTYDTNLDSDEVQDFIEKHFERPISVGIMIYKELRR
jgi:hypothetical protein